MEGKAAAIGSADFVMPFTALGLDTYAVEMDPAQITQTAGDLLRKHYAMILVAENIARYTQEVFAETQRKALPAVVIVPFTSEPSGIATESLGRLIKMATGINILETK